MLVETPCTGEYFFCFTTLEAVKVTPDLLLWHFEPLTIRFSSSEREGKYISYCKLEIATRSSYKYSMRERTDVQTFKVCLQQTPSKVTWNYMWNLTLRRWITPKYQEIEKRSKIIQVNQFLTWLTRFCIFVVTKTWNDLQPPKTT